MLLGIRLFYSFSTTGLSPSMVQDSAASFNTRSVKQILTFAFFRDLYTPHYAFLIVFFIDFFQFFYFYFKSLWFTGYKL